MSVSILLDSLVSQSSGNTFHYAKELCSLSLLKEVILRGYQVRHFEELGFVRENYFSRSINGTGAGESSGSGWFFESGTGKGGGVEPFCFGVSERGGWGVSSGAGFVFEKMMGINCYVGYGTEVFNNIGEEIERHGDFCRFPYPSYEEGYPFRL